MQRSANQIAHYRNEGFVALPPLTDPAEIAELRAIYDSLFARRAGRELGEHFDLAGNDNDNADPCCRRFCNHHGTRPNCFKRAFTPPHSRSRASSSGKTW